MNRLRFFIIQLTKQASAIRWVRIAALGLATAFGTGGIIASLLGPLPPPWAVALSRLVWVSVVFFAVTALIRRNPKREGQAVARLIAPQDLSFADRLCSAHAFEQAPLSGLSADFAQAHIARVESELLAKRAESFLPFWDNTKREILTGASVLALSAFLFWKVPRLQGGVHALFFDSFTRSPHHPKALVLKLHSVRVEPPAYLQKEARTLGESHSIEAERGSRVELIAEPLLPQVQRIEWRLTDGRRLLFQPKSQTHHTLRFIVDSDMAGCFWAIQDNKEEIENLLCFYVTSIEDKAPSVQLLSPEADLTVDPNQNLSIWAEAQDDHKIGRLEAVLRLPGGQELRKSTDADPNLQSAASLRWEVSLGDLDIEPGDILWVWAEARDLDEVSGPHVSRSPMRVLRLRSPDEQKAEKRLRLAQVREQAIQLLGDRIEKEIPQDDQEAQARFELMKENTQALIRKFREVAQESLLPRIDRPHYENLFNRLEKLLEREKNLYGPFTSRHEERQAINAQAIAALEEVVLAINALILRSQIESASQIVRELDALRQEMASLLAELRRTAHPEAAQKLRAAIARARRRLEELKARMSEMHEGGPSEFANLPQKTLEASERGLAALEKAVASDDLEQATQALFGLEQEIDGLARALAAREEQLVQEPARESKAWLSEMLDQIFDLEVEERSRAQATSELLRSALARLHEAQGEATQNAQHQLCQRSTRLEENLRSLSQRLSSRLQKRWLAAANQLKEISTALRAGEMGEAQRLALDASSALMELERALEFESLFSSWHDPSTKASAEESARRVRALRQELDALRQQIWDATPQLSHHIEANEKAQLLREREEQERILRQTESIARKIQKFPLGDFGDEISQRLSEAGRDMEEAIESLGALDLPKAHRSQEEAARKLSEIRETIQQAQQMSQAEGEASSGHRRFSREGVEIPRPEAFEAPMEWRRRVLEAMNGRTPEGFGDALRRYYESLLR